MIAPRDGSVDIHCGPKPPAGFERNWIPAVPGKNWFSYFRLYEPTEAYVVRHLDHVIERRPRRFFQLEQQQVRQRRLRSFDLR
jgi:hypothetical protein